MSFPRPGETLARTFCTPEGAPILCPPGFVTHHDGSTDAVNPTFTSEPIFFLCHAPLGNDPLANCDVVIDARTGTIRYNLDLHLEEIGLEELHHAATQVAEAVAWCATATNQEQARRNALQERLASAGLLRSYAAPVSTGSERPASNPVASFHPETQQGQ